MIVDVTGDTLAELKAVHAELQEGDELQLVFETDRALVAHAARARGSPVKP